MNSYEAAVVAEARSTDGNAGPNARTIDRRHTLAVAEDAQRIGQLAEELKRYAAELQRQSLRLHGTIVALEAANDELDRRSSEIAAAQAIADAATARLARLQRITAALGNTVTQDGVATSVLREAILALECDAGAVVTTTHENGTDFTLLRDAGSLDALLLSFAGGDGSPLAGPYADVVMGNEAIYLSSLDEMIARYPRFDTSDVRSSCRAWMFLPLDIAGQCAGVLAFGFARAREFSIIDRHFADAVSRSCAQALDRVRLRDAAAVALGTAEDARTMAEHANDAKTLFLRSMSHELRTPLNAITGFTQLLEEGIRGPVNPEQSMDLARIKRAAAYLLRLINDLLSVARFDGARPLDPIQIDLASALVEVETLCVLQAQARAVSLTVTPCSLAVVADAERLQQILLNLLTNAIKFTPPGGRIEVSGERTGQMIALHVHDTGIGVATSDIDRVFLPFVQVNRHLTKVAERGVGLGLSIGRDLARAMGGDLTLQSDEGIGSTFTVTLPAAP